MAHARFIAALAALLAILSTPLLAADQPRIVFGPERFTRTTGGTNVFTRNFHVASYVGAPFVLAVENGDGDDEVTSGSVSVDGHQILGPSDFQRKERLIEKTLTLTAGPHALEVQLGGKPDSFFALKISGVIQVGDLTQARSGHTATLLTSGRVLIAGGSGANGTLASAETFDPATLTTSAIPATLAQARADHSATLTPTNETLFAGGETLSGVLGVAEVASAAIDAFRLIPATMRQSRAGHSATLLADGRILILGGVRTSGDRLNANEVMDPVPDPLTGLLYDPKTGEFRSVPYALAVPRTNHAATLLPNGTVLITGGSDSGELASAEIFNPANGVSIRLAAALSTARSGHTATLRPDGTVLIAGGRNGSSFLNTIEVFDIASQTFSPAPVAMLRTRANHTATLLPSGEILIAGGTAAAGALSTTELIGPPSADTTNPTITFVSPAAGAVADRNAIISIRFSEPVHPASVNNTTLRLLTAAATVSIGESGLEAFLVPTARLAAGATYEIAINGVRDLAGNALAATSITFTTVPAPIISAVTPAHGAAGAAVSITGQYFDSIPSRNVVMVGTKQAIVNSASATSLSITVPIDATAGATKISVETRGGRAETDFVVDNPTPALISLNPNQVNAGSAAVMLTVSGTSFVAGATVIFGATPLPTTFINSATLTAQIPAPELATARAVSVSVTNPPPTAGPSNALLFTIIAARASIGDFVWHDVDGDGIQDSGEPGVAGVAVLLRNGLDAVVATTTTAPNGTYRFSDIAAGNYTLEFVTPPSFAFTRRDAGSSDAVDSDVDPATSRTATVAFSTTDNFSIDAGLFRPLTTIETFPLNGEGDVAVTRETIIRFSNALAPTAPITVGNFYASFGNQPLLARIHISPDRRAITLFYDRDLPPSARIRVTFIGDGVLDEFGRAIDADGDGVPGGIAEIDFETLTLTTLAGTRVCGRVFASQLAGSGNTSVNVPLANVTITVDGVETTLRTTTDLAGNFCLDPAPVGKFFVHVDGRTATAPLPPGDYYPVVGKLWESKAGEIVNIGEVYLPRVVAGTLQAVSRTTDTTIKFPPSVIAQFPQLQAVQITVPADSLFSDSGSRGGMVGIAPVPADRLPEPLPPGLNFSLVITVQTDGGSNFDRPVPACFPNLPDSVTGQVAPPNAKTGLFSFNHDTGRWELAGSATVSADGTLACSDPGEGILAPGWHGMLPLVVASAPPGPSNPGPPPNCDPVWNHPNPKQLRWQCQMHGGFASVGCVIAGQATKRGICRFLPNFIARRICGFIINKPRNDCVDYFFTSAQKCLDFIDSCILTGNPPPQLLTPLRASSESASPGSSAPLAGKETTGAELDGPLSQGAAIGVSLTNDTYRHVRLQEPILAILGNRDVSQLSDQELQQIEPLLAPVEAFLGGKTVEEFYGPRFEQLRALMTDLAPKLGTLSRTSAHYVVQNLDNGTILRGRTEVGGAISNLLLRPNSLYRLRKVFPDTLRMSETQFLTPAAGQRMTIPSEYWSSESDVDSDGDGIFDIAEFIVGTDIHRSDSDQDGVTDFAEVQQGTNPLDNRPTRTGVIATADTPGNAVDVCAVNDLAAVADSEAGVSVFNVFNGMSPTIVAQVNTPGVARAVACAGNTIAVADGHSGLAIIDITDPPAARITRQVPLIGNARAVTAAAGVAYVGLESGSLFAVDLATGSILQEIVHLQPVHDFAIEGDVLYVALYTELRAYRLSVGALELLGRITVSNFPESVAARRRVFAGGGFAYVSSYPGYDVVDVRDPSAMRIVGRATDAGPNSFKQIVANGSGLGIAAVGVNPREDGTHDVWLYDVSDPAVTTRLLTVLTTPGTTRSLSIYNGLAYAADGLAGLQVLNYLPYDANGLAPAITLRTNFAPGLAEEGQLMLLSAAVTDDVQVRNVEFFVDGVRVMTDGSFPFEHRFVTPLLTEQSSFTLRACAADTGGNRTCTNTINVALTPDATPPRVKATAPGNGAAEPEASISVVSATFTEPIDVTALSNASFRLFSAGPDSLTGTPDDVPITSGLVSYREDANMALLSFAAPLPVDLYRAVLTTAVKDRKGNPLTGEFAWTFRVKRPASWINPAGGLWNTPSNWSDNAVPGPNEIAFITMPGTYEVVATQNTTVRRLVLGAASGSQTLWIRGGNAGGHITFTATDGLLSSGTIRIESIEGGYNSGLTASNGPITNLGVIRTGAGSGGPRPINGNLINSGSLEINANTTHAGTLTNEGTIQVAGGQTLAISDTLTQNSGVLRGAGGIVLNGATLNYNGGTVTELSPLLINSVLNFGNGTDAAAFTVTGGNARAGGTIAANQSMWIRGSNAGSHTTLTIPAGLTNNGTMRMESIEGGYASNVTVVGGALTNRGTISSNGGSGGPRAFIGAFTNAGTLNVNAATTHTGTLTNTGTIDVATNQSLSFAAGNVLNFNGGAIAGIGTVVLNQATLNFNGGVTTGSSPLLINSLLNFGSSTGSAAFIMTGGIGRATGTIAAAQTLTVRGQNAGGHTTVTLPTGLTNLGTIRQESIEGGYSANISIAAGTSLTNRGTMHVVPGASGGPRSIDGDLRNEGTINVNADTHFTGVFNNSGTVAVAAKLFIDPNQIFNLQNGTISGAGTMEVRNATLNFTGGTITGSAPVLINSTLNFGTSLGAATFIMSGGSSGRATGTIAPAQTMWVRGQNDGGHTTISLPSGLTNRGTIRMESIEGGYASNLSGAITNSGTIVMNPGAGGERNITGNFLNQGTVDVNANGSYNGRCTHSGTVNISSGRTLSIPSGQTFDFAGGTLAGAGLLQLTSASLEFHGGNVTGTAPLLINSSIQFAAQTGTASFFTTGNGSVSGTIGANHTLAIRGQNAGGHTTINAADGFRNNGTLRLESIEGGYSAALNGNYTNAGTFITNPGAGGARTLSGNIANDGTIEANTGTTLSGTITHRGRVVIAGAHVVSVGAGHTFNFNAGSIEGAGVLAVNGGTFHFNGGRTTGAAVFLQNSALNFGAGTEPASFITTGNGTVSGAIAAGQSLNIRGQNAGGHTTMTAATGLVNSGTLRLDSIDGGYSTTLAVTSGMVTNNGLIEMAPGAGGGRTISGAVRNQGTFHTDTGATVSSFEAPAGSAIRGGGSLNISSGTLSNSGAIRPGSSPGRITIGAALTQLPAAALHIEIGGTVAGSQYDQLAVSSNAVLDGTLNVTLVNGFEPALGQTFDIITFPSRTGVFTTTNGLAIGNGKRFQVNYEPTRVRLQVVAE